VSSEPPLAFLYDRHASPTVAILLLRLQSCRMRAEELGWQVADEFVDEGDDALEDAHRPKFDTMLTAMRAEATAGRQVVCLVSDWYRLSRDPETEKAFRARITTAGGYTATATGEDDQPGSDRGRVNAVGRAQ